MAETIWADPCRPGRYITDLNSAVIRGEYRERCRRENGRPHSPMTEEQRLRFELDMLAKYAGYFPLPEGLIWRVHALRIQLQAKENTPAICAGNARRDADR